MTIQISQEHFTTDLLVSKFGIPTIWRKNDLVTSIILLSLISCRILNFCNNNIIVTNYPSLKMNCINSFITNNYMPLNNNILYKMIILSLNILYAPYYF